MIETGFFGPKLKPESWGEGSENKLWRGQWVDSELKDEWLERLNAIPEVTIRSVCAGGRDHSSWAPLVVFHYKFTYDWPSEKMEAYSTRMVGYLSDLGEVEIMDQSQEPIGTITFLIRAIKTRPFMGHQEFDGWWEAVILRLQDLPEAQLTKV
jgi:hypothetical protein